MRTAILPILALLGGCQLAPVEANTRAAAATGELERKSPAWRGQQFALNRCADCHSVGYGETSPLPGAPSFTAIANSPNLTKDSLADWMRNHKNFPEEMFFEIPAEHIDDVSAYMLTLRRSN